MQAGDGRKAKIPWERGLPALDEGKMPSFPGLFHASEGVPAFVPGRMDSRHLVGCVYICRMSKATDRR